MKKGNKISILGAGNVGATIAYTLTMDGMASEIVLVDINRNKAQGEAMDIIQGTALAAPVNIYAGDYPDLVGSDIVVVTLGCARKPGQTRLDLAQGNVDIIKSVMPQAVRYAPAAVYVVVSNPVDIITYTILKTTGLPASRVFGSGTLLDSSRLREMIASCLCVNPKNVHAYVLGEHGDSSMVPWSLATVGGMPLDVFVEGMRRREPGFQELDREKIVNEVHTSGGQVIKLKGATFYAIGLVTRRICSSVLYDTDSVMTLSSMLDGEYGLRDVCVSLPCNIGRHGIENVIAPRMLPEEHEKFMQSVQVMQETISSLKI